MMATRPAPSRSGLGALLVLWCCSACAQSPLIPDGAPTRDFTTVAEMLEAADIQDGQYATVAGYRSAGDDGGGVFRYDAGSAEEPDGGAVLTPDGVDGRFVRVHDPNADVHAEWFGAYGDGAEPHDDQAAINACLARYGRVKLLAKTYGVRGKPEHYDPTITYHAIDFGPHYRIEGSGRDVTTVKLLDGTDPHGSAPGNNYFSVFGNRSFHESADHLVLRDLTVDCNFDRQNKQTTIHGASIRGGGPIVERVSFRGYGTGRHPETGSSRECFVIHQTLVYKAEGSSRKGAIYRELDFTDPGHNGDIEGNVGEITHITQGGADNFHDKSWILPEGPDPDWDPSNDGENESNWWPSYGGLIENCTVHDSVFEPSTQKSPLHAITYGNCIGLTVRNNRVTDFEGAAVFVMSWWNRGVTIVDNEFTNVGSGLSLHIKGTDDKPLQAPSHADMLFARNKVTLCAPRHNVYSPIGVQLYGQSLGEGIRMRNMVIRDNHIIGRGYTDAEGKQRFPVGIVVQILHANYAGLYFLDNTIDVPDYGPGSYIPQEPHSQAMTFFPLARWEEDARSGNVVYRGNRAPDGKLLYPILQDWYYKNAPTYGMPVAPADGQ